MLEHNPIYKAIVNYKREFKEGMFRAVSCSDLFLTLSESHYLFLFVRMALDVNCMKFHTSTFVNIQI